MVGIFFQQKGIKKWKENRVVFPIINLFELPITSFLEKFLSKFQTEKMQEMNYTLYTMKDQKYFTNYKLEIRMFESDGRRTFDIFPGLMIFFSSRLNLQPLILWIKEKLKEYQGRLCFIDIDISDPWETYNESELLQEIQEIVKSPKDRTIILKLRDQSKEEFDTALRFLLKKSIQKKENNIPD